LTVNNNTIHHNDAGAGAGIGISSGSPSIVNNSICNNTTPTPGYGAVYIENATPNIVNNLIANNTGNGIFCDDSSPVIVNTTVSNNNHDFACGIVFDGSCDANIENCIIYGNSPNNSNYGTQIAIWNDNSNPYFDHCNIQDGLAGIGGPGAGANYPSTNYTNNLDTDPLFVRPSAGAGADYDGLAADWSLQVSSPCINTGDTTGVSQYLPDFDLAGNPRLYGIIDMGAYEFQRPVGVETLAEIQQLNIYPNPSNGVFFIQSSEILSRVILFDRIGKSISEINSPDDKFEYNYSHLPVGVYFVHIIGGKTTVKKIVITH